MGRRPTTTTIAMNLLFLLAPLAFASTASCWCIDAFGTSGNGGDVMVAQCEHYTYDAHVIEFMEACYARCNCWTNLPSQGGEIYKEVDAVCIHDKCYCVFAEGDERRTSCNHAFMKTDPYCCTRNKRTATMLSATPRETATT